MHTLGSSDLAKMSWFDLPRAILIVTSLSTKGRAESKRKSKLLTCTTGTTALSISIVMAFFGIFLQNKKVS